jgi:heme/copper-type cytochrome/quinol oxidase subunit 4
VNTSSRKAVRTAVQVAAAVIICLASLVPFLHLNVGRYATVGAVVIALAAAITKAQNAAEAAGKLPVLLDPTKPVLPAAAKQAGFIRNNTLLTVLIVLAIIAVAVFLWLHLTVHPH